MEIVLCEIKEDTPSVVQHRWSFDWDVPPRVGDLVLLPRYGEKGERLGKVGKVVRVVWIPATSEDCNPQVDVDIVMGDYGRGRPCPAAVRDGA